MMSKTNYQVTIGYKACIQVHISAKDEKQAKEIALEKFTNRRDKMPNRMVEIADDNYKVDGCLDMDATWNLVQS